MVNWFLCQPFAQRMLLGCVLYRCLAFGKLAGIDGKCPAGWLDRSINLSPAASLGGKRQRMVKILGGPVDRDPHEVLCALCCLFESALFTVTCQEVNADDSIAGLDSLPGKRRFVPAGFHTAFSMCCFKQQMLEACDIPRNSAFVL